MAKYSGKIGYISTVETTPGIWKEIIIEKNYCGDVVRNISRMQTTDNTNGNVSISNNISIVADPFACENFQNMKYITFMKKKWIISNVEILYPRIILSMGGLYIG
jgi:hypothetical protein